ncbi:HAD hydrolase-like protein [Chloroflexales bacterium ZM16-3]|nr:HAD hydrolase-like protein [Chloroflexales bacterium ZM16-3]
MSSTPRYTTVLFDLDGTLTDPLEGIARCIRYALERLGRPPLSDEVLRGWIGPSLRNSLASVLDGDQALVEQGMTLYRERYAPIGIYENRVYEGIPKLLADLAAAGCKVCLATSKPQIFAQHILEHFDIVQYFTVIGGASLDTSRESKADVIAYVLGELPAADRASAVMVGDREHDVLGAREHQLPAIGVTHGYGSRAELTAAGAVAVVDDIAALRDLLL